MNDTSKQHIALFLPSMRGGGAERMMMNLARGFAGIGLQVDLVLAKAEGPYLSEVPECVRVVDLNARRVLYSLPPLVQYLRRERPEVMLSTLSHANIVALWAWRIAAVPLRLVVREATTASVSAADAPILREKLMPLLMRTFYPWADGVVAISHGVAEDLINRMGISAEHVRVIYNPVVTPDLLAEAEESLNHPWFSHGEPPVILGIGRLTKEKDFPILIQAFELVRRVYPARLVILGEGEERPRLEALVQKLGIKSDVDLPGFVENPYKYMKRSGVFVLSSKYEGFGNVLVEAMACGTPVVATACPGGPAEILDGGRWGLLVPVGDAQEMAKAMTLVLQGYRIDAKTRSLEFSLNHIVRQYAKILGFEM
jgi:glycosyltransferase involved in cell wall biosynthesis